jgi:lysosomal Pro-X carboxypeptidase
MIWLLAHCLGAYRVEYFDQKVSHFNFRLQGQTFKQKVLIDDSEFNKAKGAILLYCGNEGPVEMFYENTGFYNDLVKKEMSGLLVYLEHRYFGESMPFGSKEASYSKENLTFLTTQEAVADLARFAQQLKKERCPDCPVIAFGGSYGGMLACWLRMKYPQAVDMAHCASAPIYYFRNRQGLNYESFNRIVTADFKRGGASCPDFIRETYHRLFTFRKTGQAPLDLLNRVFGLCRNMTKVEDLSLLEDFLYNGYSYMAMLNYPYPTSFLVDLPAWPANSSCQAYHNTSLDAPDESFFKAVKAGIDYYYNFTGKRQCF